MIELEIRSAFSSDVEVDVWCPEDPTDVMFGMDITVGERGVAGADIFYFAVATPRGTLRMPAMRENVLSVRNLILLERFSWDILNNVLDDIVRSCAAEDMPRATTRLMRYFKWEFEDFRMLGSGEDSGSL